MRRVAIVTGHFPPSNLAGVHRSRLWAQHLREFGWEPIIVTAHWQYYEESLDWDLHALVDPDLRVIRTPALPTKPVRLVGDIGIRAFGPMYRALADLAGRREIDFVHITIPSAYCALLGRLLHRRHGVPYGIDYIDPWVHRTPGLERPWTKLWLSQRLAEVLEPWAVREARLITGISRPYFEDVLTRNRQLEGQAVAAAMPYGGSEADYDAIRENPRPTFLFDPTDGNFHMIYAGAMLPLAYPLLERLFAAIADLMRREPDLMARFRLHFVGTGKSPGDPTGYNVKPYAERFGIERHVDEHPHRIGYVDVLNHLGRADAILVLGSTERHYSPSKIFQSVQSRRPVLAVLHEESTAVAVLREGRAGVPVTFAEGELPPVEAFADALRLVLQGRAPAPERIDWRVFEAYSARESARVLAGALDQAIDR